MRITKKVLISCLRLLLFPGVKKNLRRLFDYVSILVVRLFFSSAFDDSVHLPTVQLFPSSVVRLFSSTSYRLTIFSTLRFSIVFFLRCSVISTSYCLIIVDHGTGHKQVADGTAVGIRSKEILYEIDCFWKPVSLSDDCCSLLLWPMRSI